MMHLMPQCNLHAKILINTTILLAGTWSFLFNKSTKTRWWRSQNNFVFDMSSGHETPKTVTDAGIYDSSQT